MVPISRQFPSTFQPRPFFLLNPKTFTQYQESNISNPRRASLAHTLVDHVKSYSDPSLKEGESNFFF